MCQGYPYGAPLQVSWNARRGFLAAAGYDPHGCWSVAVFDVHSGGVDRLLQGGLAHTLMDSFSGQGLGTYQPSQPMPPGTAEDSHMSGSGGSPVQPRLQLKERPNALHTMKHLSSPRRSNSSGWEGGQVPAQVQMQGSPALLHMVGPPPTLPRHLRCVPCPHAQLVVVRIDTPLLISSSSSLGGQGQGLQASHGGKHVRATGGPASSPTPRDHPPHISKQTCAPSPPRPCLHPPVLHLGFLQAEQPMHRPLPFAGAATQGGPRPQTQLPNDVHQATSGRNDTDGTGCASAISMLHKWGLWDKADAASAVMLAGLQLLDPDCAKLAHCGHSHSSTYDSGGAAQSSGGHPALVQEALVGAGGALTLTTPLPLTSSDSSSSWGFPSAGGGGANARSGAGFGKSPLDDLGGHSESMEVEMTASISHVEPSPAPLPHVVQAAPVGAQEVDSLGERTGDDGSMNQDWPSALGELWRCSGEVVAGRYGQQWWLARRGGGGQGTGGLYPVRGRGGGRAQEDLYPVRERGGGRAQEDACLIIHQFCPNIHGGCWEPLPLLL